MRLLLDLSLQSCEISDDLVAQLLTVLHLLLELLVLEGAARRLLVESLPRLSECEVKFLARLVQFAFFVGQVKLRQRN